MFDSSLPTDASVPPEGRGKVRRRLTAEEVTQRRRRTTNWIVSLVLGALIVNALVSENGYLANVRARGEHADLRREIVRIHDQNEQLKNERARLEHDKSAVEEAGRRMGLIRDGETLVTVIEPPPAPTSPTR